MYECTWIVPSTELYKIADELGGFATHVHQNVEDLASSIDSHNRYSIYPKIYDSVTFFVNILFLLLSSGKKS